MMNRYLTALCVLLCTTGYALAETPSLLELQRLALTGDSGAARSVVYHYAFDDPGAIGWEFWAMKLAEVGTDTDRLFVAKLMVGTVAKNCICAREILGMVSDRESNKGEIEEILKSISLWELANQEASKAQAEFFRRKLGRGSQTQDIVQPEAVRP